MIRFHYLDGHVRGSDSAHPSYGIYCAPTAWQALVQALGTCREQGRGGPHSHESQTINAKEGRPGQDRYQEGN